MAIDFAAALALNNCLDKLPVNERKNVLCFGVPELCFSKEHFKDMTGISYEENTLKSFFSGIGIYNVDYLDISDYENANILVDLNGPVNKDLVKKYDIVLDMGVIQHCAKPLNVLNHAISYAKVGGIILHNTFSNGAVDQAFFQISPTFLYDFYCSANNIDCITLSTYGTSFLGRCKIRNIKNDSYHYSPKKKYNATFSKKVGLVGIFTKTQHKSINIPIHHIYNKRSDNYFYKKILPYQLNEPYINIIKGIIRKMSNIFTRGI